MSLPAPTALAPEYRYWACDLKTGKKLADLPLKPSGALPERISDVSSVAFTCDQGALQAGADLNGYTTPGRTVIVVEREYEGDNTSDPLWAGIVVARDAGSAPEATLNCATPAAYLGRRQVGTHTYTGGPGDTDTQIIADLMADAAPEGIGFILDVNCPTLRTVRYLAPQRRNVLDCLKELADMENGPEWTVVTRWATADRLAVQFVFVARTRLGWAGTPTTRFDYPGSIRSYKATDDFTEGHGSNAVIGINSSGAASPPARDGAAFTEGWPRWEETVTKSGSLDAAGLAGIAKAALAKRARGQSTVDMAVDLTLGPQFGRDWVLGDNVAFVDYGSFRYPAGHQETVRVIGHSLDIPNDTLTPVLWNPYEETT
jgi:hypothetical protein